MNWVEQNLESVSCVLTWSSDKAYLNYLGTPVLFHTLDRQILHIAKAAIVNSLAVAITYPVRTAEIALPVAIEACYGLFEKGGPRNRVILVSSSVDARRFFAGMKANYMPLNDAFPFGVVQTSGNVKQMIHSGDPRLRGRDCRLIHTTNPRILPAHETSEKVGCVVADMTDLDENALSELLRWIKEESIPSAIFIETNAYAENSDLYRSHGIPVWGWDTESLVDDFSENMAELEKRPDIYTNPFCISAELIRNWIKGIPREVVELKDDELTPLLDQMLQSYFGIKRLAQANMGDVNRQASSVLLLSKASFEAATAPMDTIDKCCSMHFGTRSPDEWLEQLRRLEQNLMRSNSGLAGLIGQAHGIGNELLVRFRKRQNPKYEFILEKARKSLSEKTPLLIVSYNQAYSEALEEALKIDLSSRGLADDKKLITFATQRDQRFSATYDECIIYGRMPYRYDWWLRAAWASKITIPLYPSEKAILRQQFEAEETRFAQAFSRENQAAFLKSVLKQDHLRTPPPKPIGHRRHEHLLIELNEEEKAEKAKLQPLMDQLVSEEDPANQEEVVFSPKETIVEVTEDGHVMISATKIIFKDGSVIFVNPDFLLPVFRNHKTLESLTARKLKPGDQIVLVRGRARENLADGILEKADHHPKMMRLKMLATSWVVALRKGMSEKGDGPNEFMVRLQHAQQLAGTKVVKNVKYWARGVTIGPQDKNNIRLIGNIYEQPFLVANCEEIAEAASRLRGLHHQILRRLDNMVLHVGVRNVSSFDEDEVIDPEFGLHVSDFAGIITLQPVERIEAECTVNKLLVNHIQR